VFDPVGTDMRGPWGPWCRHCVSTSHSLSAGASSAALAREISELINQAGWTPGWTQLPVYAGSCHQHSRLTRPWGQFCARSFHRPPSARRRVRHPSHRARTRSRGCARGRGAIGASDGVAQRGGRGGVTRAPRGTDGPDVPGRRARSLAARAGVAAAAAVHRAGALVCTSLSTTTMNATSPSRCCQPGTPRAPRRACVRIAMNLRHCSVDGQPQAHGVSSR
jgi:hypothetical protein